MRAWQVRDVMSTDVATVREDTPYREIIDVLTDGTSARCPVVDDFQHVLGVVSEADLLHKVELIGQPHERRVFEGSRRRKGGSRPTRLSLRDLMTAPAVTTLSHTPVVAAAK